MKLVAVLSLFSDGLASQLIELCMYNPENLYVYYKHSNELRNKINQLFQVGRQYFGQEADASNIILDSQSGVSKFNVAISTGQKEEQQQNVLFHDQNPAYEYEVSSSYDETRYYTDKHDASLEDFFSRPLKIAEYNWSTSTSNFLETFDPWSLYFTNARVINRISNFNLLRSKLCVKFLINGNGFHYGRLIASYNPRHQDDAFTLDRAFFSQDIIAASQRPHIYLDPTTSQGGTLKLPFFNPVDYLSIPEQTWEQMGEITIQELNPLKHANGANDRVTISVFAWAEETSMSIPTSTEPGGLVPQSQIEVLDSQAMDEYAPNGQISKPASTVARIAGMLTSAPVIGPFAKATEIAANATSSIARMFGYSRPPVLDDIKPFKPVLVGNLANTDVSDTVQKLTMDAKQELTVDPRVTGLSDVDELTIKSIATRESYLTTFPWVVAAEPETPLFHTEVNPVVWDTLTNGERTELHLPACAFAALPFERWRGTMKYRFQVVSSNFHKGRLKVVWDPYGFQSNEYNTNYTYIVDIAEEKDFTIEIGYGKEVAFLGHRTPGASPVIFGTGDTSTVPGWEANGVLAVYVVNELTVPNSTVDNNVEVNVFVKAGDNIAFAEPSSHYLDRLSWFPPPLEELLSSQAGEDPLTSADTEDTTEPSAPVQEEVVTTLGASLIETDHTFDVFYGETVSSFRQLLKRYNLHTLASLEADGLAYFVRAQTNMPYHKGYAPGGLSVDNYNYSKMTLLNWLLPAFKGYRGSLRWKYNLFGADENSNSFMMATRLQYSPFFETKTEFLTGGDTSWYDYQAMENIPSTLIGAAATATSANPVLEIEVPFYDRYRFRNTKVANYTTEENLAHQLTLATNPKAQLRGEERLDTPQKVACFVAVGEDFNAFFFTGCPIAYYEADYPPPSTIMPGRGNNSL